MRMLKNFQQTKTTKIQVVKRQPYKNDVTNVHATWQNKGKKKIGVTKA